MFSRETREILDFFLHIYRLQLGVPGGKGQYVPLPSPYGPDVIFELRVLRDERWLTRRMSIGPLGEESGSKSKCFKVIYDEILVVKLPPTVITDFDVYLKNIDAERRIAEHLSADMQCITPSVSAVLRKIPPFSRYADRRFSDLEILCMERLRTTPNYRRFLKIGEGFAFFMNLSQYAFLGQVITDMHALTEKIRREIQKQVDTLTDPVAMEDIYGRRFGDLFFWLSDLYSHFEEKLNPLIDAHRMTGVSAYQKREWFLDYLADAVPGEEKSAPSSGFDEKLKELLSRTFQDEEKRIRLYRNAIKHYVYRTNFKQNMAGMAGLIANLLSMLAVLREKRVAMRDLKPDNVFVVGDVDGSPLLLASPASFSIGLIDFETAVHWETGPGETIPQPMLAGTPSYATPAHLFENSLLERVYPDVGRILHLQDWQAVNSMIYNVVTGKRLARKTSRLMPGIIKAIRKCHRESLSKPEVYKHCCKTYWQNAVGEFREKLAKRQKALQMVRVRIPENAKQMLLEEIGQVCTELENGIRKHVSAQKLFKTPRSRGILIDSPTGTIVQCRRNWEQGINIPRTPPRARRLVIRLLEILTDLKTDIDRLNGARAVLDQESPVMNAAELIEILFCVVRNAMYRPEWGRLVEIIPSDIPGRQHADESFLSDDETRALEKTLSQLSA